MNIEIPKDLINKTDREIKELILEIGLINFSNFLSKYLSDSKNLDKIKNDPISLEKIASAIDSVLMYYQMTKSTEESKQLPISENLINQFLELYSTCNQSKYGYCR